MSCAISLARFNHYQKYQQQLLAMLKRLLQPRSHLNQFLQPLNNDRFTNFNFALFSTTPKPVVTAHPSSEPISGSKSLFIEVHLFSLIIPYSLKVVTQPAFKSLPWNLYFGGSDWMPPRSPMHHNLIIYF